MTSLMVSDGEHTPLANQDDILQNKAKSIRKRLRSSTAAIISVGGELREVKRFLNHGEFTSWVVNDCGIVMRSAQNYMRVSAFAEHKRESISLLSPGAIYRLSANSTPPLVISQVIEMLENSEAPTESIIEELIMHLAATTRLRRATYRSTRIPSPNSWRQACDPGDAIARPACRWPLELDWEVTSSLAFKPNPTGLLCPQRGATGNERYRADLPLPFCGTA
jgi:hypothetical protein